MIGGIIGLLASLLVVALGALAYSTLSLFDYIYADKSGIWTFYIGLGAWMLITSVLIIVFASKLKAHPLEHSKWGALILVFSIIGLGGLWINRRHIGISLQTHTSRRTTTIRCTTTTIWTSTPSGLPTTSTTIYYTNLPPMRKSGARKLAFLPQLRQTTKLAKLKPKRVFCFFETRFFQLF
jgi:hypothetical protein